MPPEERAASSGLPGPLGFGGMALEAWRLYRSNFAVNLGLFAALMGVVFIVPELVGLVTDPGPNASIVHTTVAIFLGLVLPTFVGGYLIAASHVVMADRLAGRYSTTAAVLGSLRSVTRDLFMSAFVATTLVLFVSLLPVLNFARAVVWGPPIIISAVALEQLPLTEAWGVSRTRLAGNWGRVILYLLVVALLMTIIQLLLYTPVLYIELDGVAQFAVRSLGSVFVTALTLPYLASAMLVAYFDLRARENDFSLEDLREERDEH